MQGKPHLSTSQSKFWEYERYNFKGADTEDYTVCYLEENNHKNTSR